MDVKITIKMSVSDQHVLDSVTTVLEHTLPYMGDNVTMIVE